MKKTIIFILLAFILVGCKEETSNIEDDTNEVEQNEDIDYSNFVYKQYLDEENPVVTIVVENYGTIKLQLFQEIAPITVNNFIEYVLEGSYNGSTFHRIIENFMIQGGIIESTHGVIVGEFKDNGIENPLLHTRGVISMARTSVFNSATSQFFIMHQDASHLDESYAAFGAMISGFDVLDSIASVDTNYLDAPTNTITIKSITVELNGFENT